MSRLLRRRRRSERGVVAVMAGILVLVLLMFAAFAVDISSQVAKRHALKNQLDATAVSAGFYLETTANSLRQSAEAAWEYYQRNGDTDGISQNEFYERVDFWCVVARKQDGSNNPADPARVADFQIATNAFASSVCNPDAKALDNACAGPRTCFTQSDYQNQQRRWDAARFSMNCSGKLCAVPCALQAGPDNNWAPGASSLNTQGVTCNTIRVSSEKNVPFSFAPAGGIDNGSTGAQVSVACNGSCGSIAPNPMDVVVIADRTPSMDTGERRQLVDGIRSMLEVMTPSQQFLSIGTIARSMTTNRSTGSCPNSYNTSAGGPISGSGGMTFPSTNVNSGQWVPLKFYDDYLTPAKEVDPDSVVGRALTCIYQGNSYDGGTSLAAPLKAAARYVLGSPYEANNIDSELGGAGRSGEIRKVIIFETDGLPQEWGTNSDATSLSSATDPMSQYNRSTQTNNTTEDVNLTNVARNALGVSPTPPASYRSTNGNNYTLTYNQTIRTTDNSTTSTLFGGQQACKNFQAVAQNAKAQGVLIITIAYGLSGGNACSANNVGPSQGTNTQTNATWISNIQPTNGTWNPNQNQCRSGNGTQAQPYQIRTTCRTALRVTYTRLQTKTGNTNVQRPDDQSITDVLADVAGGQGIPASSSNGCATEALRAEENGDGDYFFCAASGDDMAPIFVSALSQVNKGVRLLNPNTLW